jgi:hypothetical protein
MRNNSKKILVSFDLNCLTGYVSPIKNFRKENSMYPDYPPNKTENGFNVWTRPNIDILFSTLFYEKKHIFDVGVWACQNKENTYFQINQIFGSLKYSLKFALFTKPPETHTTLLPFPAKRDLKIIFDKYPEYSEKNTILFTNFHNEISEYRENEVVLPIYHPEIGTTKFHEDAHMYYINEYLIILNSHFVINKADDIREVIKQLNYKKIVKLRTGTTNPDSGKWDYSNLVRF